MNKLRYRVILVCGDSHEEFIISTNKISDANYVAKRDYPNYKIVKISLLK